MKSRDRCVSVLIAAVCMLSVRGVPVGADDGRPMVTEDKYP